MLEGSEAPAPGWSGRGTGTRLSEEEVGGQMGKHPMLDAARREQ